MSAAYIFEHQWEQERRRLDLLEQIFDPGTKDYLGRIPLPPGGHCLEVGAGAGSIAQWLCDRVGPEGRVVATDLDTGFLEQLTEKNLEVRRHNVVTDQLEDGAFDLIHSRLVLDHIPERDMVVERLVVALRPGGWLVLEDFDWSSLVTAPSCTAGDGLRRVHEAMRIAFPAVGIQTDCGLCLPLAFRDAGLADVGAEGRVQVGLGGTQASAWWHLTLSKPRQALVDTGLISDDEFDEVLRALDDDRCCFLFPTMITSWGRRPLA